MLKKAFFILLLPLFLANGCVRAKIYRAELAARATAEGREKTLEQEVMARKKEVADLTATVGGLSRTIGHQEAEIRKITADLDEQTQQMGKSASKLASEKMALEKELDTVKMVLEKNTLALEQLRKVRQENAKISSDLRDSLTLAFKDQPSVTLALENETVTLTFGDKSLFDNKGLQLSTAAKPVLTTLSKVLTSRPELDVEIVAHTDNILPKNSNLYDTWDWSLFRATNVVRALIQDYNVNANQLTPIGRGEFYPITSNETAEGRQKNRRTVVVIHPLFPNGQ